MSARTDREEMLDAIRGVVREENERVFHGAACPECGVVLVCRPGADPIMECVTCHELVVALRIGGIHYAFRKTELDQLDIDEELERLRALADERRAARNRPTEPGADE